MVSDLLSGNSLRLFSIITCSYQKDARQCLKNTSDEWCLLERVSSHNRWEVVYDGEAGIEPRDMVAHKSACALILLLPLWAQVLRVVNVSEGCCLTSPSRHKQDVPGGKLNEILDNRVPDVSKTLLGAILGVLL
jgi:hypothetical protein